MHKSKIRKSVLLTMVSVCLLITACSKNSENKENNIEQPKEEADSSLDLNTTQTSSNLVLDDYLAVDGVAYDENDEYQSYDVKEVTTITLNDTTAVIKGSGATVSDGIIRITSAGTYVISGTLTQGQIFVEEDNKGVVRLILNGATIHCENSAPIYIKNAGKTIISLEEGTTNVLTDGNNYEYVEVEDEEPDACLFSKDDLTMNGTGTLIVESAFNNGITSKDVLKIMSGTYQVTSVNHGITGRDALIVKTSDITVNSGGDGMRTNNDTDASKALFMIQDGSYRITSGEDVFQSETAMVLYQGDYTLVSGGGSSQAVNEETSMKGIKAGTLLLMEDGNYSIDSCDDAIHGNQDITINGGTYQISSGDDGIHADAKLWLSDGDITISKSYEGVEGLNIVLSGANINLVASDDGINVAGGNDSSSLGNRPGRNQFSSGNGTLEITGGDIYVDASGDGIDVNGSATMTGGNVYVSGPTNDGNGALDYDGTFLVNGGTLLALGSSGMAQAPSTDSTQYAIIVNGDSQKAENVMTIKDSDGNIVVECTPKKQYSSILYSSDRLIKGATYTVEAGDTVLATATLDSMITTVGKAGFGGGGGHGRR